MHGRATTEQGGTYSIGLVVEGAQPPWAPDFSFVTKLRVGRELRSQLIPINQAGPGLGMLEPSGLVEVSAQGIGHFRLQTLKDDQRVAKPDQGTAKHRRLATRGQITLADISQIAFVS
mgnify:FL=1